MLRWLQRVTNLEWQSVSHEIVRIAWITTEVARSCACRDTHASDVAGHKANRHRPVQPVRELPAEIPGNRRESAEI